MSTGNASGHLHVAAESKAPYDDHTLESLRADALAIIARYPQPRSALLPMLHLVQSVDGYVTGRGIALCAELLGLSTAEVSGVATFYTQFKRHPNGEYTVGVCTNTLCAIMGGDIIWEHISEYLGVGHDETTLDGKITLEKVECNAACDYAPVVMVNWEFYDNQTPESTRELVDSLRDGDDVRPSRGPNRQCTFKEMSRVLAGFHDGLADEGVGAGEASLLGLRIAKERGWTAPAGAAPLEPVIVSVPEAKPATAPPAEAVAVASPAEAAAVAPVAEAAAVAPVAEAGDVASVAEPAAGASVAEAAAGAPVSEAAAGAPVAKAAAGAPVGSARRRVVRRRGGEAAPQQDVAPSAPAAESAPVAAESGAPAALVDIPAGSSGTHAQGRFGADSAVPAADGSGPAGWDIKGNADSMLFHTPQSPWYRRTKAEVWFRSEEAALAAGFTNALDRRRGAKEES